jgi:hypothetical protein
VTYTSSMTFHTCIYTTFNNFEDTVPPMNTDSLSDIATVVLGGEALQVTFSEIVDSVGLEVG